MTKHGIFRLTLVPSLLTLAFLLWPRSVPAGDPPAASNAKGIEFFETKIRPVFTKYCYECHSHQANKVRGGLVVDSKEGLLKGGYSGPALVPGKANESLIVKVLRHDGDIKSKQARLPPPAPVCRREDLRIHRSAARERPGTHHYPIHTYLRHNSDTPRQDPEGESCVE